MADKVSVESVKPDPDNARRHPEANIDMIERAIRKVGPARSIVIDEDGTVLAGNATVEAAKRAGVSNVRIVDTDGGKLVVVRVRGLSPQDKAYLAIADNRAAELAEWDADTVRALYDAGVPMEWAWTGHELGEIMAKVDDAKMPAIGVIEATNAAAIRFGRWRLRIGREDEDALRAALDGASPERLAWLGEAACRSI